MPLIKNLLILFLCICVLVLGIFGVALAEYKGTNPKNYAQYMDQLGVGPISDTGRYELTEDETAKAKELGVDPKLLERASATELWGKDKDKKVGRGILISLTTNESANCSNAGQFDAATTLRGRGWENQAQILETFFLPMWKQYDTMNDPNSFAKDYIKDSYTKVNGSQYGGAIGCFQFLPGTAQPHCSVVGEPCDLFNPDTSMKLALLEISRCGWSDDADVVQKAKAMWCWNMDAGWGQQVIGLAETIIKTIGNANKLNQIFGTSKAPQWVVNVLGFFKLLPDEAAGPSFADDGWQLPLEDVLVYSTAADHRARNDTNAWDLHRLTGTTYGSNIYPAKPGLVIAAVNVCEDKATAPLLGCYVQIQHSDGYITTYGHMVAGSVKVTVDQQVDYTTALGLVGSTGNSTGPHVHFVIKQNGLYIDPADIYGAGPTFPNQKATTKK